MHIFLTGEIQVGKSTIIRNFLTQTGLAADGFMTYWEPLDDGRALLLSAYNSDSRAATRYRLVHEYGGKFVRDEEIEHIFNVRGVEILCGAGQRDIIVMDELGFFETDAKAFRNAVLERLSGNTPVLGVIKPRRTEFLDAVRAHPNVAVREVTESTRDAVLNWLLMNFIPK